jgi:hypothetical protein
MNRNKLEDIIREENEARERDTVREAREIINDITKQQGVIRAAQKRIGELREELKGLSVETIDSSDVLGGE